MELSLADLLILLCEGRRYSLYLTHKIKEGKHEFNRRITAKLTDARNELGKVIVGKEDILDALFISILTRGHAL